MREPTAFISIERIKEMPATATKGNRGCSLNFEYFPSTVAKTFMEKVMMGMMARTEATVLRAGIQAGTGALLGMPDQPPRRMRSQNVNRERYRLCNSWPVSLG